MRTITYGKRTIAYSLARANRKTLAITVEPDMRVHVKAPEGAEEAAIERIVRKRAAWILRQQRFFAQFIPRTPSRQYISGETHLYLGRQYRLRIRNAEQDEVKLIGGYITIYIRERSDPDHIRELLDHWYETHAQLRFRELLASCMQQIAGWDIPAPQLHVRPLTRSWGSCSRTGQLTLNLELIRAPRTCIEYVILYELCHLVHPHSAREFYKLLTAVMPDWQARKTRLERMLS
jgi:predicted metal-dependent hydrolase